MYGLVSIGDEILMFFGLKINQELGTPENPNNTGKKTLARGRLLHLLADCSACRPLSGALSSSLPPQLLLRRDRDATDRFLYCLYFFLSVSVIQGFFVKTWRFRLNSTKSFQ
jgi:hypothetical protein